MKLTKNRGVGLAEPWSTGHTPYRENKGKAKGLTVKPQIVQNKCLRTIARASRATPNASLETENFIPPIDLFLAGRIAAFRRRLL